MEEEIIIQLFTFALNRFKETMQFVRNHFSKCLLYCDSALETFGVNCLSHFLVCLCYTLLYMHALGYGALAVFDFIYSKLYRCKAILPRT